MIVYLNGDFIPKEEARLSLDDRGFLFADGAYEVFHAYDGRFFKADRHLARMARSLRELRIHGLDTILLGEVAQTLIRQNNLGQGNAVVYLQITRGAAPRKHTFPALDTPPTVYATAFPHTLPREKQEHGIRVILAPDIRWTRCDIKSIALLPNVLAHQQAKDSGAEEAVFVRDGTITEGALTNVCAVFDGQQGYRFDVANTLSRLWRRRLPCMPRRFPTRCLTKNRNTASGSSSPPTSAGRGATSNR